MSFSRLIFFKYYLIICYLWMFRLNFKLRVSYQSFETIRSNTQRSEYATERMMTVRLVYGACIDKMCVKVLCFFTSSVNESVSSPLFFFFCCFVLSHICRFFFFVVVRFLFFTRLQKKEGNMFRCNVCMYVCSHLAPKLMNRF
jgi:hypothetical protein